MVRSRFVYSVPDEFAGTLSRLLETALSSAEAPVTRRHFPLDVWETPDALMVQAAFPGFPVEAIEITVKDQHLTLRASKEESQESEDRRWLMRERRTGTFERTLELPWPVEASQVSAVMKDGLLTLTLPKAQAIVEQRIPVRLADEPER